VEQTVSEITRGDLLLANMDPRPVSDSSLRELRLNAVNRILGQLLSLTERTPMLSRRLHATKGPRTAWILLPDAATGRFRTVHVHPWDTSYGRVATEHRPAMWNQKEVSRLRDGHARAVATLNKRALAEFEKKWRFELCEYASLTGLIFLNGGPRAYTDVSECEAYDPTYLDLISQEAKHNYTFRSCAGIRLEIGGRHLGVLMLYDTVRASFLNPRRFPYGFMPTSFRI